MRNEIKEIAKDFGLPPKVVNDVYNSYWMFIRETIKKLPLKENLTEEEFMALRTSFNVPNLGKLNCTYDRWLKLKKRQKYREDGYKYKKGETNV